MVWYWEWGLQRAFERVSHEATKHEVRAHLYDGEAVPGAFCLSAATPDWSAHQVAAYLGLVPSESSSGEKQRKGRITKAGNTRVRWLLVEAGMKWLWHPRPETEQLRVWAQGIAARSGKKKAVVALARRLSGILFAMMRDGTEYRAARREAQEAAA